MLTEESIHCSGCGISMQMFRVQIPHRPILVLHDHALKFGIKQVDMGKSFNTKR